MLFAALGAAFQLQIAMPQPGVATLPETWRFRVGDAASWARVGAAVTNRTATRRSGFCNMAKDLASRRRVRAIRLPAKLRARNLRVQQEGAHPLP